MSYDALGNITSKLAYTTLGATDTNANVGSYSYGSRPHAVTSAGSTNYVYDANGSMISGDGRSIAYTVHNKPTSIVRGSSTVNVYYGPNRNRYKRIDNLNQSSESETHYLGNVEWIFKPGNVVVTKRYLDGEAIETKTDTSGSVVVETHYLLKDHLGSTHLITDSIGVIVQGQSFDPFGRRRQDVDFDSISNASTWTFDTSFTTRGFTGHEGLDPVGLIHMNGRVYDPKLGRFLSADPFVQAASNTQSFNRYAYVWNNPLSYTDPSGHFVFTLAASIAIAAKGATVGVAALVLGAAGFADALLQGASFGDALKSGILQGATAAAFTSLGSSFNPEASWGKTASLGLKFGAVGGIGSVLQGGKFGHGFLSAGVNPFAGKLLGGSAFGRSIGNEGQIIGRVLIAGTMSEVTGGKFANGAAFSAFSIAVEGASRGRTVDYDSKTNGPAPKISDVDLAVAMEEAIAAVGDALVGGKTFSTEDKAAEYLHDNLDGISTRYQIEIGARIYKESLKAPWKIAPPHSQGYGNEVYSGPVPPSAYGGTAGAWHSHPSGNPPNNIDFTNVRASDRFPNRSFVSHSKNGVRVVSGAGLFDSKFTVLERWR